jgi:prepilin-type N-terminal cleavage/methylation domain-containing protein
MMKIPHLQSKGFTIIELLVASTVFSVILLICMTGVIKMGQIFFKGTITSQTQEATRSIIDEITQGIQFSKGNVGAVSGVTSGQVCIGNKRYTFITNKQLNDTPDSTQVAHVLQRDVNPGCTTDPLDNPVELLTPGMRLTKFEVRPLDGPVATAKLWQVNVWVVYGDEDLLTAADPTTGHRQCNGGAGSEYCAVSELSATVYRRVQ